MGMEMTIKAQRSPPRAIIDVILDIEVGGDRPVQELLIIAPPGFTFDERAAGCGDNCMPGQALGSTGRRTATIASPTEGPLTKLKNVKIRVQTPEFTPDSIQWFVEGRGQGAGTTVGWGEGSGFMITQMTGSRVSYGAVANLRSTQIAFTFTMDVAGGNQIAVVPPMGYLLTCSTEGALKQISLPGEKPDCIDDPLQLRLTMPLAVGSYAFAVACDMPPETPEVNTFNIIIRDQDTNVMDAAYQMPGQPIRNIDVATPTLAWSRSDPGQHSVITVGLTFEEDTTGIKAVLVKLPVSFFHDVQKPTDVQNMNRKFPVAAGQDWAYTLEPNAIKIFLDDRDDSTTIPADVYRFSFPVQVPTEIPQLNIWYLCLCSDRMCSAPGDRNTIVSFPMDGFDLGEIAPAALQLAANLAIGMARLSYGVCMLFALYALFAA